MLPSDQAGEAYAAARALGRLLRDDGKDWHWLADRATRPDPSHPKEASETKKTPNETASWRTACNWLLANAALNEWERRFIGSIRHVGSLSAKQRAKLNATYEKYAGAEDAAA